MKKKRWTRILAVCMVCSLLVNENIINSGLVALAETVIINEKTSENAEVSVEYETDNEEAWLTEDIQNETEDTQGETEAATEETQSETEAVTEETQSETKAVTEETQSETEAVTEETQSETEAVTGEIQGETEAVTEETQSEAETDTEETQGETKAVTEETQSETEAVTGEIQGETEADTEETQVETGTVTEETQVETETATDEMVVQDLTEVVEPLNSSDSGYTVPSSIEEYREAIQNNVTEFTIASNTDFVEAQQLCEYDEVNGFSGITLVITNSGAVNSVWDARGIEDFTGIGSSTHPFKGTLKCFFEHKIKFMTDVPLIAYLGTGGSVGDMYLNCSGNMSGIVGNIVGNTSISNIWLEGSIGSGTGTVGVVSQNISDNCTVTLTDVVKVNDAALTVDGQTTGGVSGEIGKNVNISMNYTKNLQISDSVSEAPQFNITLTGTECVGGIAGITGSNCNLTMSFSDGVTVSESAVNISGAGSVGQYFGIAVGSQTWDVTNQADYKVTLTGTGTKDTGYVGQFAGKLLDDTEDSDETRLAITKGSSVSVAMTGTGNSGGFVGYCGENVSIYNNINGTIAVTGTINMSSNKSGSGCASGGLVGVWDKPGASVTEYKIMNYLMTIYVYNDIAGGVAGSVTGGKIVASNISVKKHSSNSNTVYGRTDGGGIVGRLEQSRCIISDVTVLGDTYIYGASSSGGIVGRAINDTAIELQGTISILKYTTGGNFNVCGWIAGLQENSLIYFSEVQAVDSTGKSQIVVDSAYPTFRDDVGSHGGVYRNQKLSNGKMLIGDGSLANVGVINNAVSTKTDDSGNSWYTFVDAADFETLAIALWTNGYFAAEAFGKTTDTHLELLGANYSVEPEKDATGKYKSIDISYNKTGIVTLNRYDVEDQIHAFSGKLVGVDESVEIIQSIEGAYSGTSYFGHSKVGLFSTITGDVEVSNLIISGTVKYIYNVGGIAYKSLGTGLTLKNVTMRKNFELNYGSCGGVLATTYSSEQNFILNAKNVNLHSVINAGGRNSFSGFVSYLYNATVNLDTVSIGGSFNCTSTSSTTGFLGYEWSAVDGDIKNISFDNGTTYTSSGTFGALFYKVTSRLPSGSVYDKQYYLTLDTLNMSGLTINASTAKNNCSLVIYDARSLVANMVNYDSTGCIVNNPGKYFDEIAGYTRETSCDISTTVNTTGVISLHKRDNSGNAVYFPKYHYENKVISNGSNPYAVYFYDLFQRLEEQTASEGTDAIIDNKVSPIVLDTETEVLLWDVIQLSSYDNIFKKYFTNNSVISGSYQKITFKGTLDLAQISFYPVANVYNTCTYSGDNAVITFNAEVTDSAGIKMSEWTMDNDTIGSQHYGMQGGLFFNAGFSVRMNVSNLTLTGKIANLGVDSGALMSGKHGLSGGGTYTNITLDNLWISGYKYDFSATDTIAPALMISKIPALDVSFDGIYMKNYPMDSETKAAAALIGSAGGTGVTNLVLKFHNMVIADDIDGDADSSHNSDVLEHASFLFYYCYTDEASQNKGSGIYLFSEQDNTDGKVTYGCELDDSIEFSDTSHKVLETDLNSDGAYDVIADKYKPYVKQPKKITINPKTGDILKGCGTYEDPYIIENERQLLTLYRFINETGTSVSNYTHSNFYAVGDGWKIIKPGNDTSLCTNKHDVTWNPASIDGDGNVVEGYFSGEGSENAVVYSASNTSFPTPAELSRAYYRLDKDIDLSAIKDYTYKLIVTDEFVGFGTATRPFTGVWYGKGTDGAVHTITLPDKSTSYQNYGFIQYAKGAVVKDMIIKTAFRDADKDGTEDAIDTENTVGITASGGGAIAYILGGDNIIDNVTVDVDFKVASSNATVGGYVGNIRKGGLILRNIDIEQFESFRLDKTQDYLTYPFLGAVAGKVEDGYVIYEDTTQTENSNQEEAVSYIWSFTKQHPSLPIISNYDILNGAALKKAAADMRVELSDMDINISIPNAASLQIMSMAMNADALNVYTAYVDCGYNETARCRKALYDSIGNVDSSDNPDYVNAAKYDNMMGYNSNAQYSYAYPHLYDYINITGDAFLTYLYIYKANNKYSILNPLPIDTKKPYKSSWNLAQEQIYDMSLFGKSFRGIGALYQINSVYSGTFRGNFYGNNSTIVLNMDRQLYGNDGNTDTIKRVGLFNTINGTTNYPYNIEGDFKDTISETSKMVNCFTIKDFKLAGSINVSGNSNNYRAQAGGVVGRVESVNYIFENISFDENNPLQIDSNADNFIESAGGIAGWINSGNIMIKDCCFNGLYTDDSDGKKKKSIINAYNYTGGFVGNSSSANVKVLTSDISNICINATSGGTYAYASAFVGYFRYGNAIFEGSIFTEINDGNEQVYTDCICISDCEIQGTYCGGLIGQIYSGTNIYAKYINSSRNSIGCESTSHAGGLISCSNALLYLSDIECSDLKIMAYYYAGGIVATTSAGYSSSFYREFKNIVMEDIFITEVKGGSSFYAGGVVANSSARLQFENIIMTGERDNDSQETSFSIRTMDGVNGSKYVAGLVAYTTSYIKGNLIKIKNLDMTARSNNGNVYTGGVLGNINQSVTADFKECEISNISVTAESSKYTSYAGGIIAYTSATVVMDECNVKNSIVYCDCPIAMDLYAGGLIAYVNGKVQLSGKISVTDSKIEIPVGEKDISAARAAGGAFGWIAKNASIRAVDEDNSYYAGITMSGNTVIAREAGGLIGRCWLSYIKLSDITIENGEVVSNVLAAGVIGQAYMENTGVAGNTYIHFKANSLNKVTNMKITGRYPAGLISKLWGNQNYKDTNITMDGFEISGCDITGKMNGGTQCSAAGAIGITDFRSNHAFYCHGITFDNNTISSEITGEELETGETALLSTEVDKVSAAGLVGRTEYYSTSSITKSHICFDNVLIKETNKIGIRKSQTDDIKLIKYDGENYILTDKVKLPAASEDISTCYDTLEQVENEYGYFVGNYAGVLFSNKTHIYVLASDDTIYSEGKFVTNTVGELPPVIDAGRNSTKEINDYRKYCHVVYGAANSKAADAQTNLDDISKEIIKVKQTYDDTSEVSLTEILQMNRATHEMIEAFDTAYVKDYKFLPDDDAVNSEAVSFLVYRVQDCEIQKFMESITDVMTNVAGMPSTATGNLEITCTPKLYDGHTHTDGEEGSERITAETDSSTNAITFTTNGYDKVTDGKISYTEITYTYGWTDVDGKLHHKVFKLPIFVEEPILYSVHSMVMEGRVTSADIIKDKGVAQVDTQNNKVLMTNDSDYTMLLEYTYGQIREQMTDICVDKVIYMEDSSNATPFAVGTRLLLVDVTHDNKPYYYTVEDYTAEGYKGEYTEANGYRLNLSMFKDKDGNPYCNYPINELVTQTDEGKDYYTDVAGHTLTNAGVERYLLTVFNNDTDSSVKLFNIHTALDIKDESIRSRFYLEEGHESESVWNVEAIPGLSIKLKGKGTDTDIAGEISRSKGIDIKVAFELSANKVYWTDRNTFNGVVLDSANNGKYIDLAFYLRDKDDVRINLPACTNLSYRLDADDNNYSDKKAFTDSSIMYYYKDIRELFDKPDFEYMINNISDDTTINVAFRLDFGGADMSNITDENYTGVIELLKTSNKEYPMGGNNKEDEYSEPLTAEPVKQFGFAVKPDLLDELAINTYPSASSEDRISAHVTFDFNELIKSLGISLEKENVLKKWAGYDYEVTYQIYQKCIENDDIVYKKYTGNDIVISATDCATALVLGDDISTTIGETTEYKSQDGCLTTVYRFDSEQIGDGVNSDTEGMILLPFNICQNTASLITNEDGSHEHENITNYKLAATLVIRERGTDKEVDVTTQDFFIYTVTKLKYE